MNDPINPEADFLTRRYSELWHGAVGFVRSGQVQIDPILAGQIPDQRRGLTLIAQPDETTKSSIEQLLNRLREIDPQQYYYHPSEFHVTVLALFTANLDPARHFAQSDQYSDAVQATLAKVPAFEIEFSGVTLTREAVMIQGFPSTAILDETREGLRQELRARELTAGLDDRYILQTAHMTVVRFSRPLQASGDFVKVLDQYRHREFGQTHVGEVKLVRNDWYMSRRSVEVLQTYPLSLSAKSP